MLASFLSYSDLSHFGLVQVCLFQSVVHGHWKLRNKVVMKLIAQEVTMQVKERVKSKVMQNKVSCVQRKDSSEKKPAMERSSCAV